MKDQLSMFGAASLPDTPNATSLPAAASGPTRSGKQAGRMTDPSIPEAAPAHPSLKRAKDWGLMMIVTSGLSGIPSSASAVLQSSLESSLMRRLDSAGSTLFAETWKRRVTPLRRRYWEHTASVPRIGDSGFTSVPTPTSQDHKSDGPKVLARIGTDQMRDTDQGLRNFAQLATVPTPMAGSPATEAYNAAGNSDYSRRIVELAALPTPNAMEGGQNSRGGSRIGELLKGGIVKLATVATPTCPAPHDSDQTAGRSRPRDGYGQDLSIQASLCVPGAAWDGSTPSKPSPQPSQEQPEVSGQTATGGAEPTKSTGQLNPEYSLWLNGIPVEWVSFGSLATQSVSRSRSRSSAVTSKPGPALKPKKAGEP